MKEEEKVLRTYRNFRGDNSNIYKEEQIGDFVIGITDGFNDTRHIYIHQGEPEHFGHLTSGNSLPYNFQFTPMVSKGNQADSVYNQVKEMAKNNPDISPAKIEKQIMYYEKGGSVKDYEKGKWLQGKQWHIYKGDSGWQLERYKGDNLIEQYSIDVEDSGEYDEYDKEIDFISYSPNYDGEVLIPENVQLKVITLLQKVNPKYNFGDEYDNQINENEYSEMYEKGGKIRKAGSTYSTYKYLQDNLVVDEYYSQLIERYGKKGAFERVLKDSQFGNYKGTPSNEFKHNRLPKTAIIGENSVSITSYTPNTKRYLDSKTFTSPKELAEYLDKNQIYEKGGYTLTELDKDVIKQFGIDENEYISRKIEEEKIKERQDYKVGDKVHWVQDDYKGNYKVDTSRTDEIVKVSGEKGDRVYETREIGGEGRVGRAYEGSVVKVGDKVYHGRYEVYKYEKGGVPKGVTYEYPLYFGDESGRQFVAIWYTYEEDRDDADDVFDKLVEEGAGPDEVLLKTGSGKYTKIDPNDLSDDEYELMNYGLQTSSIQGERYEDGGKLKENKTKKETMIAGGLLGIFLGIFLNR